MACCDLISAGFREALGVATIKISRLQVIVAGLDKKESGQKENVSAALKFSREGSMNGG